MPKALSIMGMVIAILILLIFVLDLAIRVPFGKASTIMDIGLILASAVLLYLSYTAFREQT